MSWKLEGAVGINYKHLNTDLPSWKLLEASKQPIEWAFLGCDQPRRFNFSEGNFPHAVRSTRWNRKWLLHLSPHSRASPLHEYIRLLLFIGNVFHDAQWVPETVSMPDPIQTGWHSRDARRNVLQVLPQPWFVCRGWGTISKFQSRNPVFCKQKCTLKESLQEFREFYSEPMSFSFILSRWVF